MTLSGAAAQEQAEMRTYSYSLQEGDVFRVRLRPHDPWGNPATETVPAACLGGEADEEFQAFIVEAYRDEEFIGYRLLLAPVERLAPDVLEPETETADGGTETIGETETDLETETTEAALQDETTPEETPTEDEGDEDEETTVAADEETTTVSADELPEIDLGQWYRVASSEECDGLYRLQLETTEEPETDEGPATPSDEATMTETEAETTEVEDETVETETEDAG